MAYQAFETRRKYLKKQVSKAKPAKNQEYQGQGGPANPKNPATKLNRFNPLYYFVKILNAIAPIKPETLNQAPNRSKNLDFRQILRNPLDWRQ